MNRCCVHGHWPSSLWARKTFIFKRHASLRVQIYLLFCYAAVSPSVKSEIYQQALLPSLPHPSVLPSEGNSHKRDAASNNALFTYGDINIIPTVSKRWDNLIFIDTERHAMCTYLGRQPSFNESFLLWLTRFPSCSGSVLTPAHVNSLKCFAWHVCEGPFKS